jgi:two-component system nitrogen regulation response regulator NtrX
MTGQKAKILLVDDDREVLDVLEELFLDDYIVSRADSGAKAVDTVSSDPEICVVVMDIKMPDMDGISAGRELRRLNPHLPVIFHTGYPGDYQEDAIDESEQPFDYVEKGKSATRLMRSVRNAVEAYHARRSDPTRLESLERKFGMVGRSAPMQEVYRRIEKVIAGDSKVMILGESGTGKELVARAIHNHGARSDGRLAILNCNHKAADIIESELFGHLKGAFTGAVVDQVGLFEFANNGTVFLDEIGDLDITTQAKLLRVIETGEYQVIGSAEPRKTDVRVICATHHDLESMVSRRTFRDDLYYRLRGVTISLPPLRDRREDIPLLVNRFRDRATIERGLPPKIFDDSAYNLLIEHDWPGNVRQLQDTVESAILLIDSELIVADDLSELLGQSPLRFQEGTLTGRLRELEKVLIIEALTAADYNISAAAVALGVDRSNFSKKIRAHGIDIAALKEADPPEHSPN